MKTSQLFAMCLAGSLLLTTQGQTLAADEPVSEEPKPTLGEKLDDATITAKAKAALLTNPATSALRTSVTTQDGVVTVTGTAKNVAERDLVTRLVRELAGVKDVKNAMTIAAGEPPQRDTLGENIDDATITAKAKAALLANRATSALRTSVTTENRVVTITGTAKNAAEKNLVTKLVHGIRGVKEVKNEMTILE
jgi:hyperosmotically inducible protein